MSETGGDRHRSARPAGARAGVLAGLLAAAAGSVAAWTAVTAPSEPPLLALLVVIALGIATRISRGASQSGLRGLPLSLVFVGAMALLFDGAFAVWGAVIVGAAGRLRGDPWTRVGLSVSTLALSTSAAAAVRRLGDALLEDQPVVGTEVFDLQGAPIEVGVVTGLLVAATLAVSWELLRWIALWVDRRDPGATRRRTELARWTRDVSLACAAVIFALLWAAYPPSTLLLLIALTVMWRAVEDPAGPATMEGRDELTGLGSAGSLRLALAEELTRSTEFDRPLSVLLVDIDHMGRINTAHGYEAGDEVVRGVAGRLRELAREYDIVARLSADAFAVVLPEATADGARSAAERIREVVGGSPIPVGASATPVVATVSVGLAAFPGDAEDREGLLTEAEMAATYAAIEGGDRVVEAARLPRGFRGSAHAPRRVPVPREGEAVVTGADLRAAGVATAPLGPDRLVRVEGEPLALSRPAPDRLVIATIVLAVAAAAVVVALLPGAGPLAAVAVLAVLGIGAEWLAESVHGRASISWAAVPLIAAAILGEATGVSVLVTAVAIAVGGGIARGLRARQTVFNAGVLVLATLSALLLARPIVEVDPGLSLVGAVVAGLLAGGGFWFVDTWFVSTVSAVSGRERPFDVWREDLMWLVPHQLGLALLAGITAYAYVVLGPAGLLLAALPAVGLHASQRRFVARTREQVLALRRAGDEMRESGQRAMRVNDRLTDALEQVNQGYLVTVESLAGAVEARDGRPPGSIELVEAYGRRLLEILDPTLAADEQLLWGFRLHDIGKVGVPDRILRKAGPLDEAEWEVMRRHPEIGARMVAAAPFLQRARDVILHHHERWDGLGYPYGLAEQAIPFAARVFAVVDGYDTMVSNRPYRRALTPEAALQEIVHNAGSHFDPEVVEAFLQIPLHELASIRDRVVASSDEGYSRAGAPLLDLLPPSDDSRFG